LVIDLKIDNDEKNEEEVLDVYRENDIVWSLKYLCTFPARFEEMKD
jgi:hypothetical protein